MDRIKRIEELSLEINFESKLIGKEQFRNGALDAIERIKEELLDYIEENQIPKEIYKPYTNIVKEVGKKYE